MTNYVLNLKDLTWLFVITCICTYSLYLSSLPISLKDQMSTHNTKKCKRDIYTVHSATRCLFQMSNPGGVAGGPAANRVSGWDSLASSTNCMKGVRLSYIHLTEAYSWKRRERKCIRQTHSVHRYTTTLDTPDSTGTVGRLPGTRV